MKRAKKNNKGFSLVELIVVVLIIGVLGVALAPQIMKWVDTSKKNTDINNAGVIASVVQAGVAEWQSEGGKFSSFGTLDSVTTSVATKALGDGFDGYKADASDANSTLGNYIREAMGQEFPEAKYSKMTDGSTDFTVTIYKTGRVEVKCYASIEAASES